MYFCYVSVELMERPYSWVVLLYLYTMYTYTFTIIKINHKAPIWSRVGFNMNDHINWPYKNYFLNMNGRHKCVAVATQH